MHLTITRIEWIPQNETKPSWERWKILVGMNFCKNFQVILQIVHQWIGMPDILPGPSAVVDIFNFSWSFFVSKRKRYDENFVVLFFFCFSILFVVINFLAFILLLLFSLFYRFVYAFNLKHRKHRADCADACEFCLLLLLSHLWAFLNNFFFLRVQFVQDNATTAENHKIHK